MLPIKWVVKNENTDTFRDNVIALINKIDPPGNDGIRWRGNAYKYYGYNGEGSHNGIHAFDNLERFGEDVTLLSLDEFIHLNGCEIEFPITI